MSRKVATVRVSDWGGGVRLVEIDCPHGTTHAPYANGPAGPQLTDDDVIRVALLRHDEEERCRCTGPLWARYGPALARRVAEFETAVDPFAGGNCGCPEHRGGGAA
jgi:hypothetical protein